jgi:hypothetical protein
MNLSPFTESQNEKQLYHKLRIPDFRNGQPDKLKEKGRKI